MVRISYLFAAVPDSDAIDKTVAAIEQAMVTVVAFGLAVESSALVERMTKKGGKEISRHAGLFLSAIIKTALCDRHA